MSVSVRAAAPQPAPSLVAVEAPPLGLWSEARPER